MITKSGIVELANALKRNRSLVRLNLGRNYAMVTGSTESVLRRGTKMSEAGGETFARDRAIQGPSGI